MYDVIIENDGQAYTIHDHRASNSENKIDKGNIAEEVNSISSFSFNIYPNNIGYELLENYKTKVKAYNSKKDRYDFVGRVLQITPLMDSDGLIYKEVVCEDRKGYLCDSLQPYTAEHQYEGDESINGLQEFIDVLLDNHNSQVEDYKKIYRGNVDLITYETSQGVYKGLNYESTWTCIQDKLIGSFGGQISLRETEGILYLDYSEQLGATRATTIEVAKNMKSATRDIDPTSIITRLIPLGTKLTVTTIDDNGNEVETETEERLTIESVNEGKKYIQDDTSYNIYGTIYGTEVFEDINDANILLQKATNWLADNNYLKINNTVEALDLSILDLDIDDLVLYDSYPIRNDLIGLNDTLQIVKKTTDIIELWNSTFELGETSKSLQDEFLAKEAARKNLVERVSKAETASKNAASTVLVTLTSNIEQTDQAIRTYVGEVYTSKSELEEYKEQVSTSFEQTSTDFLFQFNQLNTLISNLDSDTQTQFEEILKYIRFVDGNIELGEVGNPIILVLENDILYFEQNGVKVAYMSDNTLYVTDARFLNSIQIGNFEFTPRSNGNLSFGKVSD